MREYTQRDLDTLIGCEKKIVKAPKRGATEIRYHRKNSMEVTSVDGQLRFSVYFRQHMLFPENYSVGITYKPDDGTDLPLVRCNGPHGDHIDIAESDPDNHHPHTHVHQITEECLRAGLKPDKFAQVSVDFSTYEDAIAHLIKLCNIQGATEHFPFINSVEQLSFLDPEGGGGIEQ